MAALADPEDVAEAEAGEDLVTSSPGAKISSIFAQFETQFNKPILKVHFSQQRYSLFGTYATNV